MKEILIRNKFPKRIIFIENVSIHQTNIHKEVETINTSRVKHKKGQPKKEEKFQTDKTGEDKTGNVEKIKTTLKTEKAEAGTAESFEKTSKKRTKKTLEKFWKSSFSEKKTKKSRIHFFSTLNNFWNNTIGKPENSIFKLTRTEPNKFFSTKHQFKNMM